MERIQRTAVAERLARDHGGVVHRKNLRAHGVSRFDVRSEILAGRWARWGIHTVRILAVTAEPVAHHWRAVWESGPRAVLDGPAALVAQGMKGFEPSTIDISLPRSASVRQLEGVTTHQRRQLERLIAAGVPRIAPEWATIHAAEWAVTDRQAALLICLPVQQRLVPPQRLLTVWRTVARSRRREVLDHIIADVCDGAHSLGELEFATWCRRYRLPVPSRQSVKTGPSGRVYLDVEWKGLVVEIDGGHHLLGLNPTDDALRANELVLGTSRVLRIPLLGLRLEPGRFMDQVARGLRLSPAEAA
ncbi:endonuclease domain-containing protein [Kribbia dieselivorans]|uniref:endonuclease domain-containing protein n=1 Tax=Kribbia dieselivorans TaxID=331526 RepID=UPI001FE0FCF6|nr:endonuclease domain-containing protein [Kribbia dieselivorans]